MKGSQKLRVDIEGVEFVTRFDEIDPALLPLVAKLEKDGDKFGPVVDTIVLNTPLCVMMSYADKRRGPVKQTIFGQDADEFMARQYK